MADLSSIFKTQFSDYVQELATAKGGKLREAISQVELGVQGSKFTFNYLGDLTTQDTTAAGVRVVGQDPDKGQVEIVLADKEVPVYIKKLDAQKSVKEGINKAVANQVAKAMARQEDQFIIDAVDAAETAGRVTKSIAANLEDGTTDTGLTVTKLRRAKRLLDNDGVDSEGRHIAVTPASIEAMLGQTEFTSSDYASVKSLVDGTADSFLGFQFHMIADKQSTVTANVRGLKGVGTTTRKLIAWHEDALGYAAGMDKETSIDWDVTSKSWLIHGEMSGNSGVIDPAGVVIVNVEEN